MDSTEFVYKLGLLFERKGQDKKENYEEVLFSFSEFHNTVLTKDDEFKLFFELIETFQWISLCEYYGLCKKVLTKLIKCLPLREGIKHKLYIFPIIKERHHKNTKSGHFITYIIKSILPVINNNITIEDINNFTDLEKLSSKKGSFILVDDFIGGGETLENCLSKIKSINNNLLDNPYILTLAITKQSLERFKNYNIFYDIEVPKGITDFYTGDTLNHKKLLMQEIEQRVFNTTWLKKYSFGHNKQECLINLLRCPDNTFPIFWGTYKKPILKTVKPPCPKIEIHPAF